MTYEQFHNALRILINIDMHELEDSGVIAKGDLPAWVDYRNNPWRWFIAAPTTQSRKVWGIVEARQT